MVAIVTGNGLGLERSSGFVLGSGGMLGQASVGRLGSNVTVNAATGNLVIQNQDEFLVGLGPDSVLSRSYNSLGLLNDDNGDNWRESAQRTVTNLTGTVNTAGSTVTRTAWDGSNVVFTWDATRSAYVSTEGAGAYDTLTYAGGIWTWRDGNSRVTETYDSANGGRITAQTDVDGNSLTFTYTSGKLTRVTTASGDYTDLGWTGNNLTSLVTRTAGGTLLAARVQYGYDGQNRLSTVTVDLSPGDGSTVDGNTASYVYAYDGTSNRVASISETGSGNFVAFTYVLVGSDYRIQTVTEAGTDGGTRVTSFSYDTVNRITTVTDPLSKVTTLEYNVDGSLKKITFPPAVSGAAQQVVQYGYDANGNVTSVTDAGGKVTAYGYDANGNLVSEQDAAGNRVERSYGSNNELLNEIRYLVPDPDGAGAGTASSPVVTRQAYDSENHLRFVVSAEGDVTEYRYNAAGQLVSTIAYPSAAYNVSALGTTDTISEASLISWVNGITSNSGIQRTDTTYDYRGNVATVTDYAELDLNRIRYSQFESGTTGWITGYDPNGIVNAGSPFTGVTSGKAYIRSNFTATAVNQVASIATGTYNWWPVTSGERLAVQAGIESTGAVGTQNLMIWWIDAAGNSLGGTTIGSRSGPQSFGTLISGFATVPAGAVSARLELYAYASGAGTGSFTLIQPMVSAATADQAVVPAFAPGPVASDSPAGTRFSASYTRTTYVYDQFGLLLSRQTSGVSGSEVYTYDGLGRLRSSTDLAGNLTSIAINDGTRTTVVTLANGQTQTSVFGAQGELVSLAVAGSDVTTATTSYRYDKLGRLRSTTDAAGSRDFIFYDDAGRRVGYMDAGGNLVEYIYDAANRLIATTRYATALGGTAIATLFDVNGNPTTATIASVRPTATSSDQWAWSVYDNADRLIETIDGTGAVTAFTYDGADRLVQTTSYANLLAAATVTGFKTTAPTALALPTANAATDRVTRFFYDNDGLRIGTLDATGALSRTIYDEAGQAIETVGYASFVSTTALRTSGTFSQLVTDVTTVANPADRHSYLVYDGQGHVRYMLDSYARPTEYVYDAAGHVIRVVDYGAAITATSSYSLAYVSGQITTLNLAANAATRVSRSVYDPANGRKMFDINAEGYVTAYAYNSVGQVVKQTRYAVAYATAGDPSLSTMQSWVTTNGGANDRVNRWVYDALGRVAYEVDPEGYVTEHQYDLLSRLTKDIRYPAQYTVTDSVTKTSLAAQIGSLPSGAVVQTYAYDVSGQLTDVTDGVGAVTHNVYDALGQLTATTEAYGTADASETRFSYDSAGRLLSRTTAYGVSEAATTSYGYDGVGNLTSITDARGYVTTRSYDGNGNLLTETVPLDASTNAVTTRQYDAFGAVVKLTDPRGNAGYFYYDKLGRLDLQIDAEGYATATSFNIGDQPVSTIRYYTKPTGTGSVTTRPTIVTNAADATTTFAYDKLDRVTQVTDAEGYYEQYTLNAFGDRTSVRNKLGGVTANLFDKRGLLTQETLPVGSYNSAGTQVAANIVNKFSYDARGNRTQMIEAFGLAEQRTTTYAYDKANRLTSKTGDQIQVLNPATMATSNVTPVETYVYDLRGNLIQTIDAAGAKTFSYFDDNDRKVVQVDALGGYTRWTYDANGNVLTQRLYGTQIALPSTPGGTAPTPPAGEYRETAFAYDRNNRLLTTTVAGVQVGSYGTDYTSTTADLVTTNVYDAAGNLVQVTDGLGNSEFYYYDLNGRQVAKVDREKYLTVWTRDEDGNATAETRYATKVAIAVTTATTVAALQTSAGTNAADRTTTFTYDRNGNRLTETRNSVAIGTVNTTSGALTTSTVNVTITYTYNGLGEVLSKQEGTGDTTNYVYDQIGRQTIVKAPSHADQTGATVNPWTNFYYDGLNNVSGTRVGDGATVVTADHKTLYTYGAGGRMATMTDANGFVTSYYYDAAGRMTAQSYTRTKSDGSTILEAKTFTYDLLGHQLKQSAFNKPVATWTATGDYTNFQYNAYGEVTGKGVNGLYQESFSYDTAGRLWRSTANDGVYRFYVYDKAGNLTLQIASAGLDLSTKTTIGQALAVVTSAGKVGTTAVTGVAVTIYTFDKRGQQLTTREPFRETTAIGSAYNTITRSKTYNGFGEVTSETDARGNTTNYTYNTMGKLTKKELPTVSVTAENGTQSNVRPTENYAYDKSGRLVAVTDANNNTTSRTLLAGSGYGDDEVKVLKEFHPDTGIYETKFDVWGDARTLINEIGKTETRTYDKMGRVTVVVHPVRADSTQLTDTYTYDGLGQRLTHWNSQLGSTVKDTTDYDIQGRVISMVDMGGNATTYSYAWSGTIATTGMGTFGGWTKTTVNAASKTMTQQLDYFGRQVDKIDYGAHNFDFTYNLAGQLTKRTNSDGENIDYTYYNTGLQATVVSSSTTPISTANVTATYKYDIDGNRTFESYVASGSYTLWNGTTSSYSTTHESATVTWDAANRMTSFVDNSQAGSPMADIDWEYDAAGNIRRMKSVYRGMDVQGAILTTTSTQDYWYKYDSMNRFVTTRGVLAGIDGSGTLVTGDAARGFGSIVRGIGIPYNYYYDGVVSSQGQDITYDLAGQRTTVKHSLMQIINLAPNYYEQREEYVYSNDGYLMQVKVSQGASAFIGTTVLTVLPAAPTSGTGVKTRAVYTRDAMGRVTNYQEYEATGASVVYSRAATYNTKSQVTSDITTSVRSDGTWVNSTTYYYDSNGNGTGTYQGGIVTKSVTSVTKNGVAQTGNSTTNTFNWWDNALQNVTTYVSGATTNTSTFAYNDSGYLQSVNIQDGRPRTVSFITDTYGQILQRDEADGNTTNGDPRELHYYFNGMKVGDTSNNGSSDVDYAVSIYKHTWIPGTGAFRYGETTSTSYADFDQSYDPINGNSYESTASRYTVVDGDTLASIAEKLWGDASFWYLIADANGMDGTETLVAGQNLTIPNKIHNSHNNSETFQVYDPNEAIGDTSPTAPKPPKKPKCGGFGAIILIAIAVAVTVVTAGAAVAALAPASAGITGIGSALGAIAAGTTGLSFGALAGIGAVAGALGSIVSQGVGVATGIQDKFGWKGVALAALAGGVTGGISASGVFGNIESSILRGIATGVTGSAISQGFAVATGLQSKFDWTGVAVAGVASGIGGWANAHISINLGSPILNSVGNNLISGMAGAIAGASTRSLITGTDFGDNLLAELPNVIGNTIGNLVADKVASIGAKKPAGGTSGSKSRDGTSQGVSAGSATDNTPQPGDNGDEIIVTAHRKGWSIGSQLLPPLDVQNEYLTKLPGQVIKIRQTVDGPDGKPRSELVDYTLKGPGFHFATIDDAVVDAIGSSWWLRETMQDNFERGGDVIRLEDGTFTYNDIQTGDLAHPSSESAVTVRVNPKAAAWFHIHPAENPSEKSSLIRDNDRANVNFSSGDGDVRQATIIHNGLLEASKTYPSVTPNIPSYLGVYNGSIIRNDSLWNGVQGSYPVRPARFFDNISPYIGR